MAFPSLNLRRAFMGPSSLIFAPRANSAVPSPSALAVPLHAPGWHRGCARYGPGRSGIAQDAQ